MHRVEVLQGHGNSRRSYGGTVHPQTSARWRTPSEDASRVGLAGLGLTLVSVIAAVSGHLAQLLLLGGLLSAGIGLVA